MENMARVKRGNGARKGGNYQRLIAKRLSVWVTQDNEQDDVIWHTSGSGARATVRSRQNKRTINNYGDLMAVSDEAQPLFNLCVIELKTGYGKWSILDCLDYSSVMKSTQMFDSFLAQVERDCELAQRRWPVLIAKRNQRRNIIAIPRDLFSKISLTYGKLAAPHIFYKRSLDSAYDQYVIISLDAFLDWCPFLFFKNYLHVLDK